MKKNTFIAIIGGGIGGLTTALCLEYFGFKNYKIYEQTKEFREVGAAVSLWPNALKVYQKIGLYEQLRPKWGEMKSVFIKTAKGKILSTTTPKYDLPLVCIHRADLHSMLLQHISKEKLIANHRLKDIKFGAQKSTLYFNNNESVDADLILGADGINSVVRQHIINDGTPIYRGYNIWRGIATLENVPSGYASETWGKGQRVGIVPIRDDKFGWWVTANEEENNDDLPEGKLSKLQRLFGDWHHPIPSLFENSPEILKNKLGDRIPTKGWSKDNAVLVGDAAHPTTPNLGQGACMAIEGSFLIAKCLDSFDDASTAFKKYETLHYKRTANVINQSLQNGKMGQLENAVAIWGRNLLIKLTPTKLVLRMLDKFWGYDVTAIKL